MGLQESTPIALVWVESSITLCVGLFIVCLVIYCSAWIYRNDRPSDMKQFSIFTGICVSAPTCLIVKSATRPFCTDHDIFFHIAATSSDLLSAHASVLFTFLSYSMLGAIYAATRDERTLRIHCVCDIVLVVYVFGSTLAGALVGGFTSEVKYTCCVWIAFIISFIVIIAECWISYLLFRKKVFALGTSKQEAATILAHVSNLKQLSIVMSIVAIFLLPVWSYDLASCFSSGSWPPPMDERHTISNSIFNVAQITIVVAVVILLLIRHVYNAKYGADKRHLAEHVDCTALDNVGVQQATPKGVRRDDEGAREKRDVSDKKEKVLEKESPKDREKNRVSQTTAGVRNERTPEGVHQDRVTESCDETSRDVTTAGGMTVTVNINPVYAPPSSSSTHISSAAVSSVREDERSRKSVTGYV